LGDFLSVLGVFLFFEKENPPYASPKTTPSKTKIVSRVGFFTFADLYLVNQVLLVFDGIFCAMLRPFFRP
jgi:hypothetical protein